MGKIQHLEELKEDLKNQLINEKTNSTITVYSTCEFWAG